MYICFLHIHCFRSPTEASEVQLQSEGQDTNLFGDLHLVLKRGMQVAGHTGIAVRGPLSGAQARMHMATSTENAFFGEGLRWAWYSYSLSGRACVFTATVAESPCGKTLDIPSGGRVAVGGHFGEQTCHQSGQITGGMIALKEGSFNSGEMSIRRMYRVPKLPRRLVQAFNCVPVRLVKHACLNVRGATSGRLAWTV